MVDGVEPKDETCLLGGTHKRSAVGEGQPGGDPTKDFPSERALGEQPLAGFILLPCRANEGRREVFESIFGRRLDLLDLDFFKR